jgi:hypothetical protein
MPSPLDGSDDVRVRALLSSAFSDWRKAVLELRGLANQQLEAIVSQQEGVALQQILVRKSRAYEEADDAARNALSLREHAGPGMWSETEDIRNDIEIALDDLSRVESKSGELLTERLRATQAQLDHAQRTRAASETYIGAEIGTPRFLDQRS